MSLPSPDLIRGLAQQTIFIAGRWTRRSSLRVAESKRINLIGASSGAVDRRLRICASGPKITASLNKLQSKGGIPDVRPSHGDSHARGFGGGAEFRFGEGQRADIGPLFRGRKRADPLRSRYRRGSPRQARL